LWIIDKTTREKIFKIKTAATFLLFWQQTHIKKSITKIGCIALNSLKIGQAPYLEIAPIHSLLPTKKVVGSEIISAILDIEVARSPPPKKKSQQTDKNSSKF
jgi:hypothetical protein